MTTFPLGLDRDPASDSDFDDGSWDVTYSPMEYLLRISQPEGVLSVHVVPPVEEFTYTSKGEAEPHVQSHDMPPAPRLRGVPESFLPTLSDEFASISVQPRPPRTT